MKIINLSIFNKKSKSISAIVEGCQQNDASCQELLFKTYAPKLLTLCRRYEQSSFGAQDILQESFIAIFKNIKQYDSTKATVETWMKKIAVNTALKVLRKRKVRFVEMEEEYINIKEDVLVEDVEQISEEYILEVLKTLPLGYRTVFNLYVIDGVSHREIAEALSISESTSKSQLSKAKKMIRTQLKIKTNNKKSGYPS